MAVPPITRIALYKHGVGSFVREASVEGTETLNLRFKETELSDVLKSLVALDLDGGRISTISYASSKPLAQQLAEVALTVPDEGSLIGLLHQLKGARVLVSERKSGSVEGTFLGLDRTPSPSLSGEDAGEIILISLIDDSGGLRSFRLHDVTRLRILDEGLRGDLDHVLQAQLDLRQASAPAKFSAIF